MHLFDAFDSIARYGPAAEFLSVSEKEVQNNSAKYGLGSGVHYHKDLFNETMPVFYEKHKRRRPALHIAVLRIDGNYFESYHDALYSMWEFVPMGGFSIFDEIKAAGRTALGNYRSGKSTIYRSRSSPSMTYRHSFGRSLISK